MNKKKEKKESSNRYDGWQNVLTGLGIRGRDKNLATNFRFCRKFGAGELDQLYRADGMTRRVIDIVAEDMIRQGFEIDNEPSGMVLTRFDELGINKIIIDIIKWARLYGGSLGILGVADGRPLDEPINENNIRELKWIHVFDRFSVSNADGIIEGDLNSPNFGKPLRYLVTDNRSGKNFIVHNDRTIRMDWNELSPRRTQENDGWGDPLILSIYEELKNYSSAFSNSGVLIHDFVNHVLKIPNLAQIFASECGDSQVQKRIDILNMAKSVLNTVVIDAEESYEKISTNLSGLPELLDRFMLGVSSVTGIPITLLFGRAPAGLNATGESDIRNYYDMIKNKQECNLRPVLEKLIQLIFLSKDGFFKGEEPQDWKLKFIPLWQNTDQEEADIRRTVAETDAIYIDRGVLDPDEVAVSRFANAKFTMDTEIDINGRQETFQTIQQQAEMQGERENIEEPLN
jgi:uncharacterized protein